MKQKRLYTFGLFDSKFVLLPCIMSPCV